MNVRFVFNQLALLIAGLGVVLLAVELIFFVASYIGEVGVDADARLGLIATGVVGVIAGIIAWGFTRSQDRKIGRRDALLLVALSWLLGAAYAAVPFFIWAHLHEGVSETHPFRNFVDCYFEAMSGLTTTGASVLSAPPNDVESLPRSLLLWRAFTQWLGGIGIVVLFVAVLPGLGVGGRRLFRVEAPGPAPGGITPHIRETARLLWYFYLALTVLATVSLTIAGLSFFDAVCHAFCALSTGGFGTHNESVAAFPSAAVMIILILFMVLAGTNFGIFHQVIRGRWSVLWKDPELRLYLTLLVVGTMIVAGAVLGSAEPIAMASGNEIESTAGPSIAHAAFTVSSIQTTTGFVTADYDRWPFIAEAVIVSLMFIGGCAGSTAGGIKVVRIWVAIKVMAAEVERVFRPQVVRPLRVGGATVEPELKLATISYVLGIVALFAIGSVLIMLFESGNIDPSTSQPYCDYTTASTASVATLCNIGPGLARVGAVGSYGWMTDPTKVLLSVLMVIGRLEVFAILVLFTPRYWRGD